MTDVGNVWGARPEDDGSDEPQNAEYQEARTRLIKAQASYAEDTWRWEQAKNGRRIYNMIDTISDGEAYQFRKTILAWLDYDDSMPITVLINSPGGSIFSGLGIYDFARSVIADGAQLRTKCYGYVASMAGVLLQMGTERILSPNSYLMIHEASTLVRGSISQSVAKDQTELMERLQDRCLRILAERSSYTEDEISYLSDRKDWWVDADEALAAGFIDRIEL